METVSIKDEILAGTVAVAHEYAPEGPAIIRLSHQARMAIYGKKRVESLKAPNAIMPVDMVEVQQEEDVAGDSDRSVIVPDDLSGLVQVAELAEVDGVEVDAPRIIV